MFDQSDMAPKTLPQTNGSTPVSPVDDSPQAEIVMDKAYVSIHYIVDSRRHPSLLVPER